MERLTKRLRGLELLLRLGLELQSERDFQGLLERIWRELTRVLDAERSSLFVLNDEANELYSVVAQDTAEIRFPRGKGLAGAVATSGTSILISDAYADPRFNPDIDRRTGFRTRSILTVPLKNGRGEVLGVAQVLNRRDGRPFEEDDQLLMEALASMAGVAMETVQLYEEQIQAAEAVISGLLMALEMRGLTEAHHSQDVRSYSAALAKAMGVPTCEARRIEWAAALHDVGKIAIPDRVFVKDSPLTPEERQQYEAHAIKTRELLKAMDFSGELSGVEQIAPYHHKGFAGGGFPAGPPEGREVPLGARIISVADALAVQMSPRWGRPAAGQDEALAWIGRRAGRDFDPDVVEALVELAPRLEEQRAAVRRRHHG
jgi:HD-GYP domain-containing protein (c-di-GMP phosphodiesterase class II)